MARTNILVQNSVRIQLLDSLRVTYSIFRFCCSDSEVHKL